MSSHLFDGCHICNGPRRLLSRSGGRLFATRRTVSKSDAEAEREQKLYTLLPIFCQGIEPEPVQDGVSDCPQLFLGYTARNIAPATIRRAPCLESIQPRSRYGNDHVALSPHLSGGKWAGQRAVQFNRNMIEFTDARRGGAEGNDGHEVAATRQAWYYDHNWSSLDHFRHDEAVKVTEKNFTDPGMIVQRHATTPSDRYYCMKGY